MPHEPRTAARIPHESWAIRPDAYDAIVASIEAGETGHLAGDEVEARTLNARAANGGAVAVIPIQGIIRPKPSLLQMLFGAGGASVSTIRRMLRSALGDSGVGAIVLDVDSPGGMVDGVPELATEIREARAQKPIVAIANTSAASAAYWLASQATEVYVTPSGAVGSIGVFVRHEDWSKFDERLGITTTLIAAGKYKTEGNPFEPLSDEAKQAIQDTVDEYYGMFTTAVGKGRKVSASTVRSGFGEGRMVLASQAKSEGMVDQVGTFEDAVGRAATLASGGGRRSRAADEGPSIVIGEGGLSVVDLEDLAAAGRQGAEAGARIRELIRDELAQLALEGEEPPPAGEPEPEPEPSASAEDDDETDAWTAELAATSPSFRAALARIP